MLELAERVICVIGADKSTGTFSVLEDSCIAEKRRIKC